MEPMLRKLNRRSLRKNKAKIKEKEIKLVGINAAGLASKLDSFDSMLSNLQPSVFLLSYLSTKSSNKRTAIGVEKSLDPVWINEGNDNIEL